MSVKNSEFHHFDWGEDIIADITVKVVGFGGAGRFISRHL